MSIIGSKSIVAKCDIKFKRSGCGYVSIVYHAKEECDILFFLLYYSKMLYNYGKDLAALNLNKGMRESVNILRNISYADLINGKRPDVAGGLYNIEKDEIIKIYSAELIQKNEGMIINTHAQWGNEWFYAQVSVLLFLQYCVCKSDLFNYLYLVSAIAGMHEYYDKIEPWWKIESILNSCKHAMYYSADLLGKDSNPEKQFELVKSKAFEKELWDSLE